MTIATVAALHFFSSAGILTTRPFDSLAAYFTALILGLVGWSAYFDLEIDNLLTKATYLYGVSLYMQHIIDHVDRYALMLEDQPPELATLIALAGWTLMPVALCMMPAIAYLAPREWFNRQPSPSADAA